MRAGDQLGRLWSAGKNGRDGDKEKERGVKEVNLRVYERERGREGEIKEHSLSVSGPSAGLSASNWARWAVGGWRELSRKLRSSVNQSVGYWQD